MKLLVHEIYTEVYQTVIPTKNVNVEAIRPHLYLNNFPAGNVLVKIHDSSGELVSESEALEISELSTEPYCHGHFRFYIKAHLKAGTTYKIVISTTGYSFSESAYIGVCNSFDLSAYPANYSPNIGVNAPLDIEIWSRA